MKSAIAALCAASLLLPAAALANPFAADAATIRTDDLDLSKPGDQRRLESRISEAAADVCGRGMDLIHNVVKDQARECRDDVIAASKARFDHLVASASGRQTLASR